MNYKDMTPEQKDAYKRRMSLNRRIATQKRKLQEQENQEVIKRILGGDFSGLSKE